AYVAAAAITAFAATYAIVPAWIRAAVERGLVGRDMNKYGHPPVAEAGGVWAVVGTAFGLLVLVAFERYLGGVLEGATEVYALASLLLLSALLGFIDDILGWKRGLPRWQRVVFMAPISLPLVVVKAGVSRMELPLVGVVDLGLAYPLVAVPVGVLGAANAFNMVAGYNGLEAGMGLLLMLFTAAYAHLKGLALVEAAALVMAAALLAFLLYNWYPAKVFPGNSLTYGVGAYYAGLVVLGNMEKFGLTLFSLYFVELALFLRGLRHGVYKENFGLPKPDGSLDPPYDRIYSITHAALKLAAKVRGRAREKDVVLAMLGAQAAVGAAALALAALGAL
ncbi:MAG: glycosyltransferase 4 family protein, partial [Thermoproteota archaeon]